MVIGVNFNHDYAICIIDGDNIYLKEAERSSRIRHHWNETSYTLSILDDLSIEQLKQVKAIYLNPLSPKIKKNISLKKDLSSKNREYKYIGDYLNIDTPNGISYGKIQVEDILIPAAWVSHYHAHAASSFWASPFEKADIFCLDGGGDYGDGAWLIGEGNTIKLTNQYLNAQFGASYHHFAHRVYKTNKGFYESKVMAIASYGNRELCSNSHLNKYGYLNNISDNSIITVHDIADFQYQFEQGVLSMLKNAQRQNKYLCCAGGSFLNVSLNRVIAESGLYEGVYVPPYTSDMGTALGCALFALLNTENRLPAKKDIDTAFLGLDLEINLDNLCQIIRDYGDVPITNEISNIDI